MCKFFNMFRLFYFYVFIYDYRFHVFFKYMGLALFLCYNVFKLILKRRFLMATNIKDVAKKAGVSITTVSRVLNNHPNVSEKTQAIVNNAMQELNYYPHQIARALSKKQSFLIGMLVPDCTNPFFAEIIKYVELTAQKHDYRIILYNSLNDVERELKYVSILKQNRVDGIIIASHTLDLKFYRDLNAPVITFDRYIDEGIPYVACDNFHGGQLATEHLIENGCKSLLHISGALNVNSFVNRRAEAFKLTCMEKNIPYQMLELEHTNLTYEYYHDFISKNVSPLIKDIDGVFCNNDLLAYALYVHCQENDIHVPNDLKIIGYDDDSFIRTFRTPRITTIAQPIEKLATALFDGVLQLIEDPKTNNKSIHNRVLSVRLIERDTVNNKNEVTP